MTEADRGKGAARIRASGGPVAMGALVAVIVLAIYSYTLMPGVPPTDSGELALAAWEPGIAHAPGFPTYTLLAWAWTHLLPAGRVVWRLNLLSAVAGAAAAFLLFRLALRLLPHDPPEGAGFRHFALAGAFAAALSLALGRTVWLWSTVAEVYTLNLALSAAILALLFGSDPPRIAAPAKAVAGAGRRVKGEAASRKPAPASAARGAAAPQHGGRAVIAAAFLFGLALGVHLTSTAVLAPAIGAWLSLRYGRRFWLSRTVPWAALALLAGLLTYSYLPLRAASGPLLNWGDPDSLSRFLGHVTARQYRVSLFSAPVWPQVLLAARLWWTQFSPLGLALIIAGGVFTWRHARPVFWFVLLVVMGATFYAWAYVIEDDQDAYYLPAFLAASVWLAYGMWGVLRSISDSPRLKVLAPGLTALVLIVLAAMNYPASNRRYDTIPDDYAADVLNEIPPNGLVLTRDWQLYGPSLYLQRVEAVRADVTVIDTELLRRDWYFELLHRVDPALMAGVSQEERAFRALRNAWEQGELPEGDPRLNDLQTSYVALLDALIARAQANGRPVHLGPNRGAAELRDLTLQGMPDMEQGVGAALQWAPAGLTFVAVQPGAQLPPPALLDWRIEALRRAVELPPEEKIRATRADAAVLNGLYAASLGERARAESAWRLALLIDPHHEPARQLLRETGAQAAP